MAKVTLTPSQLRVLRDLRDGPQQSYETADMRSMRPLERKGLARYLKGTDQWKATAAGLKVLKGEGGND